MGIAKPKNGCVQSQLVVVAVENQFKWNVDRSVHFQCSHHYHQRGEITKMQSMNVPFQRFKR